MKTIYQLVANDWLLCFSRKISVHSKKVFTDRKQALKHYGEFKKLCCGGGMFDLRGGEEFTITITELELSDPPLNPQPSNLELAA